MKRPILWATVFLIVGIVLGYFVYDAAPAWWMTLPLTWIGFAFIAVTFICICLYCEYKYLPILLLIVCTATGIWRVQQSLHNYTTETIETRFTGTVRDVGITASGNQRAIISGEHPILHNTVRVMAYINPELRFVDIGQTVTIIGALAPLARPGHPGDYDQLLHLRGMKIDAVMWPQSIEYGGMTRSIMTVLMGFRDRLAHIYDQALPYREAAIIKAMTIGDRLDMTDDLSNLYRAMGIFHIISISGLHITILMLVANKLFSFIINPRKAGIIVLGIMILYCMMTGMNVATVRSVMMGGVLVLGKTLYKDYDLLASLSLVCLLLLLYEPFYLFNAGFQLSFIAVFGIGVFTEPIERLFVLLKLHVPKTLSNNLAGGIAAVISTYPVIAYHFYEIPTYSVLGNLVILPTTTIILVVGILIGLVGLFYMPAAILLAGTAYYILRFYELAGRFFINLPLAILQTGGGSILIATFGFVVLFAFLFTMKAYGKAMFLRSTTIVLAVILLFVAVHVRAHPKSIRITALDTYGGYTVMRLHDATMVSGKPFGGEDAVLSYLKRYNTMVAGGLILLDAPRPQDLERLIKLLPHFKRVYVADSMGVVGFNMLNEAAEKIETQGMPAPKIIMVRTGDVITNTQLQIKIQSSTNQRLDIKIIR